MKKQLLTATLCAAALLAGPLACAAVIDLSSAEQFEADSNITFGNSFVKNQAGSYFNDRFEFTTTGLTALDLTVSASYLQVANRLDLTDFSLYDSGNHLLAQGVGKMFSTRERWTLAIDALASGSYYLMVSGKLLGTNGGTFAATGTAVVTQVPEPSSYVMFGTGLALLLLATRRRPSRALCAPSKEYHV